MIPAGTDPGRRRSLLAALHAGKRELGLDEDTYHLMLEMVTGKDSAALMTIPEITRVLDHMRGRGWQGGKSGGGAAWRPSSKGHVRKVWALWAALRHEGIIRQGGRAACRAFVKRMTGCSDPEWLTPEEATVVIEALKAMQRRHALETADTAPPQEGA